MPIYLNKDNNKKLLRKAKRDDICTDINGKYEDWRADLESPRREAVAIMKELFPDYNKKRVEVKKIPDVYEQYKTYTSALYKAIYQSYEGMFDIEGQDLRSNNIASAYKASLVYDYYRMNLKSTLDAVLDDWTIKGEGALFVHWDEDIVRKQVIVEEAEVNEKTGEIEISYRKSFEDIVEHEGVHVKRIDPHNLYYDKSQRYNWEMCGKIYRDFIPIQYVLTNTEYSLSDVEKKELLDLVKNSVQEEDLTSAKSASDKKVIGNCVEVLEYRGDYLLPNTTDIVKNVTIVVIAGKYLAMLEESQYVKCPIIYGSYLDRPDSGRGQSPLKPAYILAEVENRCMDLSLKAWELNVSPVFIAPKGAFPAYTKLEAGKPLEYDANILGGVLPQKVDFSAGMRGFDFQAFFKQKMEGATGITQYMQGSQEGAVRTASESTFINQGATTRIAREAYLFTQRILLPMVETHALFKRTYEKGSMEVPMHTEGATSFIKIDDEIRNGRYTFIIGGSQSTVERQAEIRKLFELLGTPAFQSMAQLLNVDTASELLRWVLNQADFKGTDQIFEMMNINSAITKQANQLGVQPQNQQGFQSDMMDLIKQSIPDMAGALSQPQPEALQQ